MPSVPRSQIVRGPAPLPARPERPVPLSKIDRSPAPLPVNTQPVVIPRSSIDTAAAPVTQDPTIPVETMATVADLALPSEALGPPPPPPGPGRRLGPVYLPVAQDGSVVVPRTTLLNFTGNGVTVTSVNGLVANVDITGGAAADLGNWAFRNNIQYNINGGQINNSDPTHGATALLSLPAYGDDNALSLLNYYGPVSITAGTDLSTTQNWLFDGTGTLVAPGAITTTGNIFASYFVGDFVNVTGVIYSGDILPQANAIYSLGSIDTQWKELWVSGNTIYLANTALSVVDNNLYYEGNLVITTQAGNNFSIPGNLVVDTVTANVSITAPEANITGSLIAANLLTDNLLHANGAPYDFNADPGGNNTQIQFNDNGVFAGSAAFTFDNTINTVSVLGNVTAQTAQFNTVNANLFVGDGSGLTNLSVGSVLANGTSNVSVPVANGDIVFSVAATSNVMTISPFGVDILGNLTVTGNVVGNLFIGDGRGLTRIMAQRGSDTDNWDLIAEMGVYKVNRTSWAGTTGTPLDSGIFKGLLQVASEADGITQIFFPGTVTATNVKLQWVRSYLSGAWTNWYKIINDDQTLEGGAF